MLMNDEIRNRRLHSRSVDSDQLFSRLDAEECASFQRSSFERLSLSSMRPRQRQSDDDPPVFLLLLLGSINNNMIIFRVYVTFCVYLNNNGQQEKRFALWTFALIDGDDDDGGFKQEVRPPAKAISLSGGH